MPGPLEQFWNALGFVLVQGYGMTETTALITLNHPFHVAKGSIGKPMPGREVKLGPDGELLVRGPMISTATWAGGAMRQRQDEWLATGDLAETQSGGGMRFLGRKSETIVTAAGVNLHPEDIEAEVEQEAGVTACAVVALETPSGPEPYAVLACRGDGEQAPAAVERANTRLADFQRIRRWALWPEPDLPRTSTGKVKRKPVAAWLAGIQAAARTPYAASSSTSSDWLVALVAQIAGETPAGQGDELRLTEDLHLDSLGRVQLAAAIEEKLGMSTESGLLENIETLGELRKLVAGETEAEQGSCSPTHSAKSGGLDGARSFIDGQTLEKAQDGGWSAPAGAASRKYVYPRWPWLKPVQWLRTAFIEAVMRPLVWLLANPRVVAPNLPTGDAPLLIVANHVTAYDGPLVQYALPAHLRRRIAAAMSGEMLWDFRHFRNPDNGRFSLFGPLAWLALTALFNVFPLPRLRNFQASFAHAGKAMDRGFNVLVFPEGTRSAEGKLAGFRGGIGLLAKQSGAMVLPVAICGLGELKTGKRRWFRSGTIEVRVGQPIRFAPEESEAAIAARLHAAVEQLLEGTED